MLQSARFCELHRTYSSNISVFRTDISDILSWVIHLITKIIMSSLLTCCAQQNCLLSNKSFFVERLKVIFSHSAFLKPAPWRSTALWLKWHIFIMAFDDTSRCARIFLLNKRGHWLLYCIQVTCHYFEGTVRKARGFKIFLFKPFRQICWWINREPTL